MTRIFHRNNPFALKLRAKRMIIAELFKNLDTVNSEQEMQTIESDLWLNKGEKMCYYTAVVDITSKYDRPEHETGYAGGFDIRSIDASIEFSVMDWKIGNILSAGQFNYQS